jgi:hypothetical protein
MKQVATLDVNPKEIGRHVFKEGWYDGEITFLGINEFEAGDALVEGGFRQAGDRELVLRGNLLTDEGTRGLEENLTLTGNGAFKARGVLLAMGVQATTNLSDNPFRGTKIKVEYNKPREGKDGTEYSSFKRLVLE